MAKVIITCGKICCGKTTYAKRICKENGSVLLSVDEVMLTVFGNDVGERHEEITEKIKTYLKRKTVDIVGSGIDAVLDWGLWTRQERFEIRSYFEAEQIECEIHYIKIEDEEWSKRISRRNNANGSGNETYYVDEGLKRKCESLFETPDESEYDKCITV